MTMTKILNSNVSRIDAALLMCYCDRCNPADDRLQSAGINTDWSLERPGLPSGQLKGRVQGSDSPPPTSSRLCERNLLDDPTILKCTARKLVTVCKE